MCTLHAHQDRVARTAREVLFRGTPQKALVKRPYKSGETGRKMPTNPLERLNKLRLNVEHLHEQVRGCFRNLPCTGLSTGYAQKLWMTKFGRLFENLWFPDGLRFNIKASRKAVSSCGCWSTWRRKTAHRAPERYLKGLYPSNMPSVDGG